MVKLYTVEDRSDEEVDDPFLERKMSKEKVRESLNNFNTRVETTDIEVDNRCGLGMFSIFHCCFSSNICPFVTMYANNKKCRPDLNEMYYV